MDGTPYREFFARPTHPYHRRYEALRAVFLDGRSQKEVAEHFGYRYSTLRQLVYEFRRHGRDCGGNAKGLGKPLIGPLDDLFNDPHCSPLLRRCISRGKLFGRGVLLYLHP